MLFFIVFDDIYVRKIKNKKVSLIFLLSILISFFNGHLISGVISFLFVLILGMILFKVRIWGAGDSKLSTALAMALTPEILPDALILTAMVGGVLSVFYLLLGKIKPEKKDRGIPYGIAISSGFYLVILLNSISV
ncbi:A24 family peptidase [Veronia pacifica]